MTTAIGSRHRSGAAVPGYNYPIPSPPAPALAAPPARWTLYDPATNELGTFVRNPVKGGEVAYGKKHSYAQVQSRPVLQYGQDDLSKGQFDGYVLTDADWVFFQTWMNHDGPLIMTDDLGRQTVIVIEAFEPTRVRKATVQIYHTFRLAYLVCQVLAEA